MCDIAERALTSWWTEQHHLRIMKIRKNAGSQVLLKVTLSCGG